MTLTLKRAGGNTLRPVTIKQILDAQQAHPDAEFRIDGVEVGQVSFPSYYCSWWFQQLTFVAMVRSAAMQSTNVTYRMEDGTGMIDVKQWIDAEQGAANAELP
jgi:replication factor A2